MPRYLLDQPPIPPRPDPNVENYAIRRSFKFYKAQIFEMEVLQFTEDSDSEFGSILAEAGMRGDLVFLKDKKRALCFPIPKIILQAFAVIFRENNDEFSEKGGHSNPNFFLLQILVPLEKKRNIVF